MRVVIADDHALLRQGLITLMRDAHLDWSFWEGASFDDAIEQLSQTAADLLLIDLNMPGMAGGQSLQSIREVYPDTRIAVLTGTENRDTIIECLAAGVHGYILKADAAGQMLHAIEVVLSGGVYVPPVITRIAATPPAPPSLVSPTVDTVAADTAVAASTPGAGSTMAATASLPKPAGLTPRQTDVLRLLAEGSSTKDIARKLNLGLGTVKVHLAGVYRALGATNRMEAVVRAGRVRLDC